MTVSGKKDPFTGQPGPRADRFRLGDSWLGSNGTQYRVVRGVGHGLVCLHPIGFGPRLHLAANSIGGFTRVSWGGQP